jgi:hypothetical protein
MLIPYPAWPPANSPVPLPIPAPKTLSKYENPFGPIISISLDKVVALPFAAMVNPPALRPPEKLISGVVTPGGGVLSLAETPASRSKEAVMFCGVGFLPLGSRAAASCAESVSATTWSTLARANVALARSERLTLSTGIARRRARRTRGGGMGRGGHVRWRNRRGAAEKQGRGIVGR